MTVEIRFAPDEEARLRDRAAAAGQDVQTFVREAVVEKLDRPTFGELLAPVHEAVRGSGVGVDELAALADQAREEYWAEQRANRNSKP